MDDHLVALKSRMSPLRTIGVELLSAAIRAYNVFWPESQAPASVDELSKCLMACEEQMDDWRSSAARVGADEALGKILNTKRPKGSLFHYANFLCVFNF